MILYQCTECGLPFVGDKFLITVKRPGGESHFDFIGCLTDWAAANGFRDDDRDDT